MSLIKTRHLGPLLNNLDFLKREFNQGERKGSGVYEKGRLLHFSFFSFPAKIRLFNRSITIKLIVKKLCILSLADYDPIFL